MQRKRNEDGGLAGGGLAVRQRNRTVHSENRLDHNEKQPARNKNHPARSENHHNIRRLSSKSRFSSNVAMVWKPPITTKAPVPIVVVLKNVLCRGLGLAAPADRVNHDVQQQQHNGYDHDEHGKLALAPVAAGQRLLLVDVLLVVLGAHAMHQQAMVVHAVGVQVTSVTLSAPGSMVSDSISSGSTTSESTIL